MYTIYVYCFQCIKLSCYRAECAAPPWNTLASTSGYWEISSVMMVRLGGLCASPIQNSSSYWQ